MCSCLEKIRRKPWKNFVHDTVPQLMSDIMECLLLGHTESEITQKLGPGPVSKCACVSIVYLTLWAMGLGFVELLLYFKFCLTSQTFIIQTPGYSSGRKYI